MHRISSREHPLVKHLVKLQKSAQLRQQSNTTILDGIHLIQSYLSGDTDLLTPLHLIVSETGLKDKDIISLVQACQQRPETKLLQVTDLVFEKISAVKTPSGVLAHIAIPSYQQHRSQRNTTQSTHCVLIEAIQDPGNLGTMIRTAAAAGIADIYLSENCADVWSPKTLRAAMGAHFFLALHSHCDLINVINNFQGRVLATSPYSKQTLYQTQLSGAVAFVFGNEGAGLSKETLCAVDQTVAIPMPGKTESLNAATALAVCLFEKVRQEHYSPQYVSEDSKSAKT